jgi:hypothetical protein
LQMIATHWDALTDEERAFMLSIVELHRRRQGLEGLDDIVQVVSEHVGARRSAG